MSSGSRGDVRSIARSYDDFPVSIVVTDPRLPDNPIVYVNRAFTELTGYSSSAACGRNCRFLQGPDTDKVPVRTLGEAIAADEPAAVEIVNYTAMGEKFLNHLVITPIRDGEETIFFLGIQAGWSETNDISPGADKLTQHLSRLESQVRDQIANLLTMIREEIAQPSDPHEVITLLSSRVDCLAQLYAGVFRRHSKAHEEKIRLGAYLGRVCSGTHVADRSYNVRLSTNFAECVTDARTAASIGLVLSELLANAFEDTNPYDDEAEIEVDLERRETKGMTLRVKASSHGDDGTLLPKPNTLGRRLLSSLLPKLGTTLEENNRDGVREVILPLPMLETTRERRSRDAGQAG